ncbi:MAG: CARDB domain-containing protein [Candidatus Micrarchaeia archaeon]
MIKKKFLLLLLIALPLSYASITSATILNVSFNQAQRVPVNMSWDIGSTSYIDSVGGNPDTVVQVCVDAPGNIGEIQNKYVMFVYRTGNVAGFQNISKDNTGKDHTQLTNCSGTCCMSAINNVGGQPVGPYNFYSGTAVYPAYIYAIVSDDQVFTESDTFIAVGPKSHLRGAYTTNDVESTYNSATGNVTLTITGVTSYTRTGSATNNVNLPYFQLGICEPSPSLFAWACTGGRSGVSRGVAYSLHTGVVSPPDTAKYTKYYLINGIDRSFCIGPDPAVVGVSLAPSTQFAGGQVLVTVTIRNDGNVDITQPFDVNVYFDGIPTQVLTVAGGLAKYTSTTRSFTLNTGLNSSGPHTILARLAPTTIADCDLSNNQSSAVLTIVKTYRVRTFINGIESKTFPDAGRPYNLTINVTDSDGVPANVTVRMYEVNGISLFSPIQRIDSTTSPYRGLKSVSYGESRTRFGIVNYTIIPTGNKLYTPEYAYLQVSNYVGEYSLYLKVYNITSGEELQQTNGTALISQYNFTLLNMSARIPSQAEEGTANPMHRDEYISQIAQFAYNVFAALSKWIG